MNILVTGGHGFIGSNFIDYIIDKPEVNSVVNIDCASKAFAAADERNTLSFKHNPKYYFYDNWIEKIQQKVDQDKFINSILKPHNIDYVVHFAAETHVDVSITDPRRFLNSNVVATFNLLDVFRSYPVKRFHHISTDEVYGSLGKEGKFTEESNYKPNSPYSASKAASDMFCRAYIHTFGLPITISNCSNNYGPKQKTEKLIPKIIDNILNNKKIPVYGTGENIRDWIYVEDHCDAIWTILNKGTNGESYNVGGDCEKNNLEIVNTICSEMGVDSKDFIEYIEDRKGHDFRYAIHNTKINKELNWFPKTQFKAGIEKTIRYYKEIV
jgi:dTDP-glucose 4,6-dehydratase